MLDRGLRRVTGRMAHLLDTKLRSTRHEPNVDDDVPEVPADAATAGSPVMRCSIPCIRPEFLQIQVQQRSGLITANESGVRPTRQLGSFEDARDTGREQSPMTTNVASGASLMSLLEVRPMQPEVSKYRRLERQSLTMQTPWADGLSAHRRYHKPSKSRATNVPGTATAP
jgi:hypothetical protein